MAFPPSASSPNGSSEETGGLTPSSAGSKKAETVFGPADFDEFDEKATDLKRENTGYPPAFKF